MRPGEYQTLYQCFSAAAAINRAKPAFTFLDAEMNATTYSYGKLFEMVERIACQFAKYRFEAAAPIGILLASQESQVLHYLSALAAGLIPAILTPPNRKLNRAYYLLTLETVLRYCQFSAVITDLDDLVSSSRILHPYSLQPWNSVPITMGEGLPDIAFMQFSSGTTGIKRGVRVSHQAVLRQLEAYADAIQLTPGDTILSWLPLYHDMGFVACLNMPLAFGTHTIMIDPIDWVTKPGIYLQAASQYRASLSWNPNFAYAFMAERVPDTDLVGVDLSSIRGLVNCSEPVTKNSQERFTSRFEPYGLKPDVFWGCYAMAETTFALTHGTSLDEGYLDPVGPSSVAFSPRALPFVSVGRPLKDVQLRIVDEQERPGADRQLGEIWVRSPYNFVDYYNSPEATRQAFSDGWYKTGDLGYRVGPNFFVCGRKKDIIIVGGVNIYPQDIEAMVSQVEKVIPGRVAVFAEWDEVLQTERPIILAESTVAEAEQIRLRVNIRQEIQAAFHISHMDVRLVPPGWLIKSSAGKMARGLNREKWHNQRFKR